MSLYEWNLLKNAAFHPESRCGLTDITFFQAFALHVQRGHGKIP